jgi:hypothetical protein
MRYLVLSVSVMLGPIAPAAAQSLSDEWQVTVVPYLMGAGLSGTVGARALETDISVSASDVFSHLEFGVMGIIAVRKGAWGIGADAMYLGLGATTDRPPADLDFNQTAVALYGFRSLGPAADVTFGFRINGLDGAVATSGPIGVEATNDQWWVDPIVGILLRSPEDRRALLRVYTEVGGFGAGSDIAWQVFPSVGIRLHERLTLEFGYRWQGTDYKSGEGADQFVWDTIIQGPAGGVMMRF